MDLQMTPESTPTRYVPEPSEPKSTFGDTEHHFPSHDELLGGGMKLDIPMPENPPEHLLLNVVMTFTDAPVRLDAVEVGVVVESDSVPRAFRQLIEETRGQLASSEDARAELLRYPPTTWFRFVPPGERPKTLTERFNEAYDEDARREDEEFFRTTKAYYRRRFNAEE
jgi:hypothetical protein